MRKLTIQYIGSARIHIFLTCEDRDVLYAYVYIVYEKLDFLVPVHDDTYLRVRTQ